MGACRGKWARASAAEVAEAMAAGLPCCYRFRVPPGQVVKIQVGCWGLGACSRCPRCHTNCTPNNCGNVTAGKTSQMPPLHTHPPARLPPPFATPVHTHTLTGRHPRGGCMEHRHPGRLCHPQVNRPPGVSLLCHSHSLVILPHLLTLSSSLLSHFLVILTPLPSFLAPLPPSGRTASRCTTSAWRLTTR
jgi:hypothetical protein